MDINKFEKAAELRDKINQLKDVWLYFIDRSYYSQTEFTDRELNPELTISVISPKGIKPRKLPKEIESTALGFIYSEVISNLEKLQKEFDDL